MPKALDVLSVRDLVALATLVSKLSTSAEPGETPEALVRFAFGVADAFTEQSTGFWAMKARGQALRPEADAREKGGV